MCAQYTSSDRWVYAPARTYKPRNLPRRVRNRIRKAGVGVRGIKSLGVGCEQNLESQEDLLDEEPGLDQSCDAFPKPKSTSKDRVWGVVCGQKLVSSPWSHCQARSVVTRILRPKNICSTKMSAFSSARLASHTAWE